MNKVVLHSYIRTGFWAFAESSGFLGGYLIRKN